MIESVLKEELKIVNSSSILDATLIKNGKYDGLVSFFAFIFD